MAALPYPISTTEATTFATIEILYSKYKATGNKNPAVVSPIATSEYSASCSKTLTVALDPNVDRTLINPTEAYSGSSS